MRPTRIISSLLLGTTAFIGSQNISAHNKAENKIENKSNSPAQIKSSTVALYQTKLKALCELPEERLGEMEEVLNELQKRQWVGLGSITKDVINISVPYCKKILEKNLELLKSNDLKKQIIGSKNLTILSKQFNCCFGDYFYTQMNVKEDCLGFIKWTIEKTNNSKIAPRQLEVLIKSNQALLSLCPGYGWLPEPIPYPAVLESNKLYVSWLTKQVDNSIKNKSKQNQKLLETIIREETDYVVRIHPTVRMELFQSLTSKYIELLNHNISDPDFLYNSISNFIYLYTVIYNYGYKLEPEVIDKQTKPLKESSFSLFYTLCNGIEKFPDSKEKKAIKAKLLEIPTSIDLEDKNNLDKCMKYLSNILCKNNSNDTEEYMKVVRSLLNINFPLEGEPATNWSPYLLHNFMANNVEYFEKNTLKIIEAYKTTNKADLKAKLTDEIIELYTFFNQIFTIKRAWIVQNRSRTIGGEINDITPPELKPLFTKTNTHIAEKLERPLFKIVLSNVENWKEFTQKLQKIENLNPKITSEIRGDIIANELKGIEDPQLRKIYYEILALVVLPNSDNATIVSTLKNGIIKDEPRETLQSIGKILSLGTLRALESIDTIKEYNFFSELQGNNKHRELASDDITQFHRLTLDLVRILDGDFELSKTYLPDRTFKTKDGKVNTGDLSAYLKLRRNAFLILASSASNYSEYSSRHRILAYQNLMTDLLESKFERYGTSETIVQTWGEEVAMLIEAYSATKETLVESKKHINTKLDFLRKRFFDGIEQSYEIDGEKKTYTTLPLFNRILESEFISLNPKENRKILDELHRPKYGNPASGEKIREVIFQAAPKLQAKYTEMREQFALAFLRALSNQKNTYIDEYLGYLSQLGYSDSERENIAKAFLN
ncbi:MAG: hypothetical protein HY094_02555 [Candidatus Melainabacteria bacterium]|nr:hypothetical protein [Candidatus Melainabacteria bacterium]